MLDLLLLTVPTPRKVHRDGIQCHGVRYLSLTLAAYVGEQVTVRYDPQDLADALRHPVREPVPADAVTNLGEPPVATASTPNARRSSIFTETEHAIVFVQVT